jgi:hypothetical protein
MMGRERELQLQPHKRRDGRGDRKETREREKGFLGIESILAKKIHRVE